MTAPYRDSTPRHDAAPRVRRRWAMRRDELGTTAAAKACFSLWAFAAICCAFAFVCSGAAPYVLRWAAMQAVGLVGWALVFVTRERVS